MEKKILVAVDGSQYCYNALKYAAMMATQMSEVHLSLYHVQAGIPPFLVEESKKNMQSQKELLRKKETNRKEGDALVLKCRDKLIEMGVKPEMVDAVSRPRILGVAQDIAGQAQALMVDAVLIGRRGLGWMQSTLMGSVTSDLMEQASRIPVWVVDGDVSSERVLLAVDGSEHSFLAADHLCFMFTGYQSLNLTLLHIVPAVGKFSPIDFNQPESPDCTIHAGASSQEMENFYGMVRHRLKEAGIPENQMQIRVASCTTNVGKTILSEAESGGFGTIVMGRRKDGPTLFSGSVSKYVLDRISRKCAWIVS